jgi:hypothetical protein
MKKIVFLVFAFFILIAIAWGQTNQYGISDADEREILALIHKYHLMRGSLAYRSAVIPRMLTEANLFAEQLKLPIPHPIQINDIKDVYVSPPWISGIDQELKNTNIVSPIARIYAAKVTIGGAIQITNFVFSFDKGKLCYACRMKNGENALSGSSRLEAMPSLIDNAQAYQLATQWLTAVSVDVPTLEKKYKLSFYQWFIWSSPEKTNKNMLPIFDVKWGEGQMPLEDGLAAKVTILGTTKELMELRIGDEALSRRPQMIITNALELTSTPDPPLKQLQHPFSP